MSNILSAIRDDEEFYAFLCKKYNQKPIDCYSVHSTMLNELHRELQTKYPPAMWLDRIAIFEKEYRENAKI